MDPQVYRDRQAAARGDMDAEAGYHRTALATLRGALHGSALDDALVLAEQAVQRGRAVRAALDVITGNEAAASFAEALALRDEPDAPTDLDDWLREMLDGSGGLVGGYL